MTGTSNRIFWIHHLGLRTAPPSESSSGDAYIFVWDNQLFERLGYTLKRLVFIYETLCEMPVHIAHGNTVEILAALPGDDIATWHSDAPDIQDIIGQLEAKNKKVHRLHETPFCSVDPQEEFRRFSKYWPKAEKTALLPDGKISDGKMNAAHP